MLQAYQTPLPIMRHTYPLLVGQTYALTSCVLLQGMLSLTSRLVQVPVQWPAGAMEEAYARCGVITKDYAKTFYLVSISNRHVHGCCVQAGISWT